MASEAIKKTFGIQAPQRELIGVQNDTLTTSGLLVELYMCININMVCVYSYLSVSLTNSKRCFSIVTIPIKKPPTAYLIWAFHCSFMVSKLISQAIISE